MQKSLKTRFPVGIGTMSKLTGCSAETIRYYEKQRLLPEASRTQGGHRLYGRDQLKLLQFLLRARKLGFSQPDVRRLLKMADPKLTDCAQVHELAAHQLSEVRVRLRNLRKLERTLQELVARCEEGGQDMECPIIESLLDEA